MSGFYLFYFFVIASYLRSHTNIANCMNSIVGIINRLEPVLYFSGGVVKCINFVSNLSCHKTLSLHDHIITPAPRCRLILTH